MKIPSVLVRGLHSLSVGQRPLEDYYWDPGWGRGADLALPWLLSSPGPDFCINKKSWRTKVRVFSQLGGLWAGGG